MQNDLLVKAISANAVFSGTSGLILATASIPLASWLEIPVWVAAGVGIGLVAFAMILVIIARDPQPHRVVLVIVADIAWVGIAAATIVLVPDALSLAGKWALGVVSVVVAALAAAQFLGLTRVAGSLGLGEPVHL